MILQSTVPAFIVWSDGKLVWHCSVPESPHFAEVNKKLISYLGQYECDITYVSSGIGTNKEVFCYCSFAFVDLAHRIKALLLHIITKISITDKPARRAASRWTCCKQVRWTLSVINLRPSSVDNASRWKLPICSYRNCIWPTPPAFGTSIGRDPIWILPRF